MVVGLPGKICLLIQLNVKVLRNILLIRLPIPECTNPIFLSPTVSNWTSVHFMYKKLLYIFFV